MLKAKPSKFVVLLLSTALIFLLPGALASAADVGPGDSIQAAIDSAQSGDTITVEPGTYNEKLSIEKSLTLTSTGSASETIINADGLSGPAVSISADDVTIDGFTVQLSDGDGLSASGVSGLVLKNNIFLANGRSNWADGVQVENVNNVLIEGNTFKGNSSHGLYSVSSSNLTVIENSFKDQSNFSAILFFSTVDSEIKSNLVESNVTGIAIGQWQDSDTPSSNITIVGNTVQDNTGPVSNYSGFGIWISANDITVRRNTIINNSKGVFVLEKTFSALQTTTSSSLAQAQNSEVTNSLFNKSDISAAVESPTSAEIGGSSAYPATAPSASNIKIQENVIKGNSTVGMENQASNQINSVFNWWGAKSGPSYDGPGAGDKVSGNITFDPWLKATEASPAPIGIYDTSVSSFELRNKNSVASLDLDFKFGFQDNLIPIAGDWDDDGKDTIGVYQPSTATFFLKNSNEPGGADKVVNFGVSGWTPIAGDWDDDGKDTIGVYQPSTATFFLKNENSAGPADISVNYGVPNWTPIAGDWDDDGKDTIGSYNANDGRIYLKNKNTPGSAHMVIQYGGTDKKPITGNWATSVATSTSNSLRKQNFNSFAMGDVVASPNPVSVGSEEVKFKALGEDVRKVQVSVLSAGGNRVFKSNVVSGNTVTWSPSEENASISNGLYLYQLKAIGPNGNTSSKVGKLMVIR